MPSPTGRALVNAQAVIESFSLSADGERLVYALRRVRAGRYVSHLWSVPWSGGRARRLTSGAVRDVNPAISPDGRLVAFARTPVGPDPGEAQIWIMPLDDGEPWQLTKQRHGAGTPVWSPDGRRIAFLGQAGDDRFIVGPVRPKQAPVARRIIRTDFRDDDSGQLGRRTHMWTVTARPGARPRRLTHGDFDVEEPAWAPDGSWIAFTADMGEDWNLMPRTSLYRVPSGGGAYSLLAELAGDAWKAAISPDGRNVAFLGSDVADPPEYALTHAWVAPVDGGPPRCLTPRLDRSIGNGGWADLVMADDQPGPAWLDAQTLVVIVGDRGRNVPHRLSLDGQLAPLVTPGRVVGCAVATAAGRVALSAGVDRHAAELYALDEGRGGTARMRRLTTNGSGWQDRFPLPAWEEAWIEGPGGPIQTWIVSPPRAGRRRLPTIVVIHGGPTGSHAPGGTMDSIMLAGHGYRLALANIRGSDTHGAAWIRALDGRWGQVDAGDIMAVVDALVERGLADPDRLGVMGLSYGGYLTQWLVGHTDRFRAAVAENGVANQVSAWGNSYFGVHYNRRHNLGDPLTERGMRRLWRTSPISAAADIHTPLLMLQAEEDRNCPASDNEQLFTALRVLGREVEYILYPEEHHEMKNYGRPDRRIDRMGRVLAWFDRLLGPPSGRR
ncbi:MAG TPA: S9 family peptidase [Candidatus Limnocylindria bacterium]|jgi:dipeptidyl aminopeptidase/acylaminoacyl peptidase